LHAAGLQIRQIISESLDVALDEGVGASYPYAAGLRFSVDGTLTSRVSSLEFEADGKWIPIRDTQEYTLITTQDWATSFLHATGTILEITPYNALVKYALRSEILTPPEFSTLKFVDIKSDKGILGLAFVPKTICVEWVPGQGVSNYCSKEKTSSQGGGVANVVAWSILDYLHAIDKVIDMFLLNAGDCLVDIEEGPFEEEYSRALLPFDHPIVFLELTGQQLMDSLEQAIHFALAVPKNRGAYPYAGGLRFEVRASETLGNRVSKIEYFTGGKWKAVTPERQYILATTLPLADGEQGYNDLYYAVSRTDPGDMRLRETFVKFVKRNGTIEDVPLEKYSTQAYIA
jgi:hypothetical protein